MAPAELEALLLTHSDVADAAVVGVPDERAGEVPKAFVVLKDGRGRTRPEDLRQYVDRKYTINVRPTFIPFYADSFLY